MDVEREIWMDGGREGGDARHLSIRELSRTIPIEQDTSVCDSFLLLSFPLLFHALAHPTTRSLIQPLAHPTARSLIQPLAHSSNHLLTHPTTRSLRQRERERYTHTDTTRMQVFQSRFFSISHPVVLVVNLRSMHMSVCVCVRVCVCV